MFPKDDIVLQMHYIHDVLWVILLQELENFQFYSSLVHILLLIFYYFQSYFSPCLVVNTLQRGSKRPLTQELQHFIPITNMVILHVFVVALVIIIAKIKL